MKYKKFHGQYGEDSIVRYKIPNLPEIGFYVDVGSGHWQDLSNTYHFDRCGWKGLCIEAHPKRIKALDLYRSATVEHCAISTSGILNIAKKADLSTVGDHLRADETEIQAIVPCFPLETILQKHNVPHIDLLSIDVEGQEEYVWKSMDPNRKPTVVIIEYNTHGKESRKTDLTIMMVEAGYNIVGETEANLICHFG